ncbi:MAG TPA: hypothetical protein VFA09_05130 [Ktedonobacteraceae bacterium]|nr:hypothetical protein [Ktedonobacteraceae bacterium]
MLEQVKIITSRRAYEFQPDDLRLSALSTKPVQEQVQSLFRFQTSVMGSPIPTFGDVPATYPPGFVFDMGVWIAADQHLVPIRFLHFEQRRIVIDVAGTSSAITDIYERLNQFFAELRAPDGSPIIGEPKGILDYSEITAKYPFSLDILLAEPFRELLKATFPRAVDKKNVMIPAFGIQFYPDDQELQAMPIPGDVRVLTFTLRVGTNPDEHIYFSGAPLDSDTHLRYLSDLEAKLTT